MRILCALLCLLAAAALAEGAESQPQRNILVLPFQVVESGEGNEELGELLADLFLADLSSFPDISLVERAQLKRILQEQRVTLAGLASKESRLQVGKLAGARLILTGTLTMTGQKARINAHLMEVESTRILHSRQAEGQAGDWIALEQQLARALAEDMKLKITEKQELAIDQKPEVSLHFMRGLGYFYGCKYDQAITEFQHTLRGDGRYADARYWMARSYQALAENDHAALEYQRVLREFPDHPKSADAAARLKQAAAGAPGN